MAIASIRPAAVAGMFYPADPQVLQTQVDEMLTIAQVAGSPIPPPKVLIVPHAGYIYSGAIAARGYATLNTLRHKIKRVILIGPAHRMPVSAFALPAAQVFRTPLGDVPVSRDDWLAMQQRDDVVVDDRPHAREHSLEVQLPFLQALFDSFEILPVLVGHARSDAVADVLASLWGGPETLLVISSDLSHFHSYEQARSRDRATVADILRLQDGITPEQACGAYPLNGLLRLAAAKGLKPHLIDLCNSGDTAGDRNSVVGYASIALCEESEHDTSYRH